MPASPFRRLQRLNRSDPNVHRAPDGAQQECGWKRGRGPAPFRGEDGTRRREAEEIAVDNGWPSHGRPYSSLTFLPGRRSCWRRAVAQVRVVVFPSGRCHRSNSGANRRRPGLPGLFLDSGDPTFLVGRHSVRFGDGLEGSCGVAIRSVTGGYRRRPHTAPGQPILAATSANLPANSDVLPIRVLARRTR